MLVMLVTVIVVSSVLLSPYEMLSHGGSFPFAATWTSNLYFAFGEQDYFSTLRSDDLFLHTWSLGVEEQFYLLWPWVLLLLFGLVRWVGNAATFRQVSFALLAVVFASSFALNIYLSSAYPIHSFYMMPSRGWQFALGSAVYVACSFANRTGQVRLSSGGENVTRWLLGPIGVTLILGSGMLLDDTVVYPGYYALFPSVGAALVSAAGALATGRSIASVLAAKPFVWVGDRSYSLYLWHWPILVLGKSLGFFGTGREIILLVGLSGALAALTYRFVELPFWKGRFSNAVPSRVVAFSVAAMIASIGTASALQRDLLPENTGTPTEARYSPRADWPVALYANEKDCDTAERSADVVPCEIKEGSGEATIVLLGDSIGAQWSPMLPKLFDAPKWNIIVFTKSACPFVDKTYFYKTIGANYTVCTTWRNIVLDHLADIKPDIVFVGSSAYYEFGEPDWVDGSRRVLERLSSVAGQVILIPGNQRLSFDGPSCLNHPEKFSYRVAGGNRACEEARSDETAERVALFLGQASQPFANVSVLDLADLICPEQLCAAETESGVVVYRDTTHLTATYVKTLVPNIKSRLSRVGQDYWGN
jgi:peptidoglycan/LPS O-acetylase OafA/YrhL